MNFTSILPLSIMIVLCSDWSSRGLETQVDDNGNVICISTHLTSFAVLVDFSGAEVTHIMYSYHKRHTWITLCAAKCSQLEVKAYT